jgi:hypothetical protein
MNVNPLVIPTLAVGCLVFRLGETVRRRQNSRAAIAGTTVVGLVLAFPAVLFAAYYLHLFDDAAWFYEFRSWRFVELAGAGIGFPAGYAASWIRSGPAIVRRGLVLGVAVLAMLVPYAKGIFFPVNLSGMRDQWSDGVCLQSSSASCGPSCAATLLKQAGIEATEREIAAECYTCTTGTENWYMARALRRRGLLVDFATDGAQPEALRCPAIAGARLGTRHGAGHFIAVLDATEGAYVIGDPLQGRLTIPRDEIHDRYYFTGFFMVVRRR